MKDISFSKIFVLAFIFLIVGTCLVPLFSGIFNIINDIIFILRFYFFYQIIFELYTYYYVYLINEILPYIIITYLIFEFFVNPWLFNLGYRGTLSKFIYTHVLKKEFDFFESNSDNNDYSENEEQECKSHDEDIIYPLNPEEGIIQYNFHQKIINLGNNYWISKIQYYLRKFSRSLNSFFTSFFSFSSYFLSKLNFYGRVNI